MKAALARRAVAALAVAVGVYVIVAYLALPDAWLFREDREAHPALVGLPVRTADGDGVPGDPLNVALVGSELQVAAAMQAAGWRRADPVDLRTALGIAESVLLDRPDPQASISPLYVWGRPQDMAFEREIGRSASRRHHLRLWVADEGGTADSPLWIGDAMLDRSAGLSHRTGEITHHIDGDVDAERDGLIADLRKAGCVVRTTSRPGMGATGMARNAGGDRFHTDGLMTVAWLKSCGD